MITPDDSLREVFGNVAPGDDLVLAPGDYDRDADLYFGLDYGRLSGVTVSGASGEHTRIHADSFTLNNVAECLFSRLGIHAPMRFTGNDTGRNLHGFRMEHTWHRAPSGWQIILDGSPGDPDYAMEFFTFDTITLDPLSGARYGILVNSRNADSLHIVNSRLFSQEIPLLVSNGNVGVYGGGCGAIRRGPSMWINGSMDSHVVHGVKFEPQGNSDALYVTGDPAVSVQGCDLKAPGGKYALNMARGNLSLGGCYIGHHGGGTGAVKVRTPEQEWQV